MQEGTPIIIKKVKKGGHGHHGGAWKVAYADFVTAMMAFFLVMWILGMSSEDKESIAAYFQSSKGISKKSPRFDPALGLTKRPPAATTMEKDQASSVSKETKELSQIEGDLKQKISEDPELKGLMEGGDVEIHKTSEGLQIDLIENETTGEVFFESGSPVVRPQAKKIFASIAPLLAKTKRLFEIEGHTDRKPFAGANGYDNFDLSADRALSVKRLLTSGGVSPIQILSVTGKADQEPRKPEDPYHFSNRRVTILLPFKFAPGAPQKLPATINDSRIEGAFSLPGGVPVPPVDLKAKFEAKKAEEEKKSHSADH